MSPSSLQHKARHVQSSTLFTADQFRSKVNIAQVKAYSSPTYQSRAGRARGDSDSSDDLCLDEKEMQEWARKDASTKTPSALKPDRSAVHSASGYRSRHDFGRSQTTTSHSYDAPTIEIHQSSDTAKRTARKTVRAPKPIALKPLDAYIKPHSSSRYRAGGMPSDSGEPSGRGYGKRLSKHRPQPQTNHFGSSKLRDDNRGQRVADQTRSRANELIDCENFGDGIRDFWQT